MNIIPSEDVYESPEYSGPLGYGRAINIDEWDDSADMPIAEGFEIPMSFTDDQLAALRGMPNFNSDTNLSENIRGAMQSAPSYVRRRRYRRRSAFSSRKYRPKRRTYTRKRKYNQKYTRKVKRRVITKKRRYKKRKPATVVYIR